MKKILLNSTLIACAVGLPAAICAEVLDFSKIVHWTGEGDNEAALIVQFDEPDATDPGAVVWGYRWPSGETRTSDEMIRAIARESSDLLIFVQYTGGMGYTLDGIGYSPDVNAMLDGIWFDYESAFEDGNVLFGYFEPNTGMGQTSAPGTDAIVLSYDAIAAAADSHIIEHPLNAQVYGYPAYDYDHWKLDKSNIADTYVAAQSYWRSGWYWGYWSFWIGSRGDDMEDLSYSGFGMSSTQIYDGQISGWKYQPLSGVPIGSEGDVDASTGALTRWCEFNYEHFSTADSQDLAKDAASHTDNVDIYTLGGVKVGTVDATTDLRTLSIAPGLYIIRKGTEASKLLIQ